MNGTPNERMLQALEEIRDRSIPIRPAHFRGNDYAWVVKQYSTIRQIAALALMFPEEKKHD